MSAATIEPGSFRDPNSRVVEADGVILRLLSEQGLRDWSVLEASQLFRQAVAEGKIIGTEVEPEGEIDLPDGLVDGAAAMLRHEVVPFVSYPYEWPFAMLKDAALLQLELLRRALDENLILKDSSPYNVQSARREPVFIDVGSFESLRAASPGSATGSSACSSSTRCCSRPIRTSRSSRGCAGGSTGSRRRSAGT